MPRDKKSKKWVHQQGREDKRAERELTAYEMEKAKLEAEGKL